MTDEELLRPEDLEKMRRMEAEAAEQAIKEAEEQKFEKVASAARATSRASATRLCLGSSPPTRVDPMLL